MVYGTVVHGIRRGLAHKYAVKLQSSQTKFVQTGDLVGTELPK